ncbi:DsrE family protein [Papillibacter cinnamivorans]|uniref:Uncharacterized protein n=1 Tax=Papillibacter cinnamivorans DSM 12816 TaxID=1122930 RepID=A0A1W2C9K9_9FIRM|nr:DsrE family protein [Papillibacter cinnamivorans]SMC81850.1 hypothetical protein SAMN02745168_2655 [Papillibacter cinnamivorans DSM 12816]
MAETNRLYILWTNADLITSDKMVMMYAINSKLHFWWEEVTVIIWGATAKLVAENASIQEKIRAARQAGVHFSACKACSDQLGVSGKLRELGIEVIFWGEGLTAILKENRCLLTV